MYTGYLIDGLMDAVERAEQSAEEQTRIADEVDRWFAQSEFRLLERNYQGVA